MESIHNKNQIGAEGRYLESVDSTNNYLKDLANCSEIPHGYYVATEYQTSGRGQVGNSWLSDPAKNLLISLLIRPDALKVQHYFYLNMSVCLSIVDTLNELHQGFLIKWPNDILFDNKKIGGVLIENSISSDELKRAIVGIGINVNQKEFPPSLNMPAISLAQIMGRSIDLQYFRDLLFKNLNLRWAQMQQSARSIHEQYHQYLYGFGLEVPAEVGQLKGSLLIEGVSTNGTLNSKWQGRPKQFQFKELKFLF